MNAFERAQERWKHTQPITVPTPLCAQGLMAMLERRCLSPEYRSQEDETAAGVHRITFTAGDYRCFYLYDSKAENYLAMGMYYASMPKADVYEMMARANRLNRTTRGVKVSGLPDDSPMFTIEFWASSIEDVERHLVDQLEALFYVARLFFNGAA